MRILCAFVAFLFIGLSHAADRELATEGNDVRLTISNKFKCSAVAAINITTLSAAYFDQDAETIQRLADVSRAVLGFECPKITKIEFTGFTDKISIFKAGAQKSANWEIQSYPAPLESLALFFSRNEPEFFHLGTINNQLNRYSGVKGIFDTYQFKAYEHQAKRLISIVDGNTDLFKSYLKDPGKTFASFEKALTHYNDILKTIEKYAPEHYPAYNKTYEEISSSLKDEYWSSRVASLTNESKENVAGMVDDAIKLIKTSSSNEFSAYVDTHIASAINEDIDNIKPKIAEATLNELAQVSSYVANFPTPSKAGKLADTRQLLETLPNMLIPLIIQRKGELQTLATDVIKESGEGYEDVESIFETGFSLAEEFEEAEFIDEGQQLLTATFSHIDHVLQENLQNYKNDIITIELNSSSATALQEQALAFEELSAEFKGFKAYQKATEEMLEANKNSICLGILKEASVNEEDYNQVIHIGDEQTTLSDFTCELYENSHIVSKFARSNTTDSATLDINEAGDAKSHFLLKVEKKGLRIHSRIDNEEKPISEGNWQDYITNLIEPLPSGKADDNGVRECDKLAADPYDSQKLATGFDFEKEEVESDSFDRALDACIASVEDDPNDQRQLFQLGRLLLYAGDQDSASEYINLASSKKYAAATFYKAEILLSTKDSHNAFVDALRMFSASAKGGYARGKAMVKELNPEGIAFYKEIPPPTAKNVLWALPNRHLSGTWVGYTTTIKIVNVKLKNCFQTAARDFSCEYRKTLSCNFSGNANRYAMAIVQSALRSDCNSVPYEFSSFRKLKNGKWKILPN